MARSSGLVIHITLPEIGASPDGIISCECCGVGSLEIKCPYTMIDLSRTDIEKLFLVRDCNGGLTLDRRHEHYYQVQCQLFVCDTNYAEFVV
ncbi:hypothetical protein ACJMK2_009579 [Sinanodonta woodiana]|uniref:YqaJ viral recombinase domain-containing protein n=1 Tax=Sinanodonta woodiana TaxID=1069815 RepID=A0ABD3VCN5_SINWO